MNEKKKKLHKKKRTNYNIIKIWLEKKLQNFIF